MAYDLTPNKRGIDNNVAKQSGMPSSGSMSAAGGLLPAQRQQQPFEQVGKPQNAAPAPKPMGMSSNGTINGGAVQGAQFKTTAQPMSPGVASYVSIPSFQPPAPQATGTGLPNVQFKQQPSFAAGTPAPNPFAQPSPPPATPNFGVTPQQQAAASNAQDVPPQPTPFDPRAQIAEMRDFYNEGGAWDANTRAALQQQMAGNTRATMLRDAMAGRGSNLGQIAQDRANLDTMTAYEAQRGQLQQQAQESAYAREMTYAQQLNETKMQLMQAAAAMGMTFDDADFNQMAAEQLQALGVKPGSGGIMSKLEQGAQNTVKRQPSDVVNAMKQHLDRFYQNETAAAAYIEGLSAAELKAAVNDPEAKKWLTKALDDSWGDDYDRIAAALAKAGIPVWED